MSISAQGRADELRFGEVPDVQLRTWGDTRSAEHQESERVNLPRPLQPGALFRDVRARMHLGRSARTTPLDEE